MHLHWNVVGEGYSQLVWKHHKHLYLFHDYSPGDVTMEIRHCPTLHIYCHIGSTL